MLKLNRKGFTLVEILAVVVILAIIMAIAIPNVNSLIIKNKRNSCESLKNNIINASKLYFSDYRYKISVNISECESESEASVTKINGLNLNDSKLPMQKLIDEGYLKETDNMSNPLTGEDITNTNIIAKYNCEKKDYTFSITDINCE